MATTNLDVIRDALRVLNVIAENEEANADQSALGLAVMNDLLEDWSSHDIDVGQWPQTDFDADFPGAPNTVAAVKANLAVWLAPHFGATLRPETIVIASSGYSRLLRVAVYDQLKEADMTALTPGAGNAWLGFDS